MENKAGSLQKPNPEPPTGPGVKEDTSGACLLKILTAMKELCSALLVAPLNNLPPFLGTLLVWITQRRSQEAGRLLEISKGSQIP